MLDVFTSVETVAVWPLAGVLMDRQRAEVSRAEICQTWRNDTSYAQSTLRATHCC